MWNSQDYIQNTMLLFNIQAINGCFIQGQNIPVPHLI